MKKNFSGFPLFFFILFLSYEASASSLKIDESIDTTRLQYGPAVSFNVAKKIIEGSELNSQKRGINTAISIVDSGGNLVMFSKSDNTHLASINVSKDKAITALGFRRSTKLLQDAVNSGKASHLTTISGMVAIEGGVLIIENGKISGAIGVSGGTSSEDADIARAGIMYAMEQK